MKETIQFELPKHLIHHLLTNLLQKFKYQRAIHPLPERQAYINILNWCCDSLFELNKGQNIQSISQQSFKIVSCALEDMINILSKQCVEKGLILRVIQQYMLGVINYFYKNYEQTAKRTSCQFAVNTLKLENEFQRQVSQLRKQNAELKKERDHRWKNMFMVIADNRVHRSRNRKIYRRLLQQNDRNNRLFACNLELKDEIQKLKLKLDFFEKDPINLINYLEVQHRIQEVLAKAKEFPKRFKAFIKNQLKKVQIYELNTLKDRIAFILKSIQQTGEIFDDIYDEDYLKSNYHYNISTQTDNYCEDKAVNTPIIKVSFTNTQTYHWEKQAEFQIWNVFSTKLIIERPLKPQEQVLKLKMFNKDVRKSKIKRNSSRILNLKNHNVYDITVQRAQITNSSEQIESFDFPKATDLRRTKKSSFASESKDMKGIKGKKNTSIQTEQLEQLPLDSRSTKRKTYTPFELRYKQRKLEKLHIIKQIIQWYDPQNSHLFKLRHVLNKKVSMRISNNYKFINSTQTQHENQEEVFDGHQEIKQQEQNQEMTGRQPEEFKRSFHHNLRHLNHKKSYIKMEQSSSGANPYQHDFKNQIFNDQHGFSSADLFQKFAIQNYFIQTDKQDKDHKQRQKAQKERMLTIQPYNNKVKSSNNIAKRISTEADQQLANRQSMKQQDLRYKKGVSMNRLENNTIHKEKSIYNPQRLATLKQNGVKDFSKENYQNFIQNAQYNNPQRGHKAICSDLISSDKIKALPNTSSSPFLAGHQRSNSNLPKLPGYSMMNKSAEASLAHLESTSMLEKIVKAIENKKSQLLQKEMRLKQFLEHYFCCEYGKNYSEVFIKILAKPTQSDEIGQAFNKMLSPRLPHKYLIQIFKTFIVSINCSQLYNLNPKATANQSIARFMLSIYFDPSITAEMIKQNSNNRFSTLDWFNYLETIVRKNAFQSQFYAFLNDLLSQSEDTAQVSIFRQLIYFLPSSYERSRRLVESQMYMQDGVPIFKMSLFCHKYDWKELVHFKSTLQQHCLVSIEECLEYIERHIELLKDFPNLHELYTYQHKRFSKYKASINKELVRLCYLNIYKRKINNQITLPNHLQAISVAFEMNQYRLIIKDIKSENNH